MPTNKKSKEYIVLEKRIGQIKKHFKIPQLLTGITPLQEDRLRGMLLLCHAEFEDYFESIALRLINKAEEKWKIHHIANYNLSALFIYHDRIAKNDLCLTKAGKIIADYKKSINENHGIKEENIKKIFLPLGYSIDEFDRTFLLTLEAFGELRGRIAHISAKKTTQPLNGQTEIATIEKIKEWICDFEGVINSK